MKRFVLLALVPALVAGALVGSTVPAAARPTADTARLAVDTAKPTADTVRPAAEPKVLTGTVAEFVQRIPAVQPIKAGYKGTSSFIPPSVVKGKDRRGCNLRQRMLIDSAYVKPKVGRKCALTGGVWWVDQGTKKVTKAKDVAFTPMLTLADAWGQGASQWTPAQRLAWATDVARPGPATPQTRAQAIVGQGATQQLVSAEEMKKFNDVANTASQSTVATIYTIYCNRGLFTLAALTTMPSLLTICSMKSEDVQSIFDAGEEQDRLCHAHMYRIWNVSSWGLSLPPADVEFYTSIAEPCKRTWLSASVQDNAQLNGIIRIPEPQAVVSENIVPQELINPVVDYVVKLPFTDYSAVPRLPAVSSSLFGVAAPVDWGDPGVPTGYLRLWDAGVSWRQMQPDQGKPIDWEKLDRTMQMADRLGAKVMYVLGDTPAWANGGKSGAVPPTNLDDAASFIGQVCARYKTRPITSFEAWNEGNLTTFWTGTMDELASLTQKVKQAVRACGSGARVYASSTGTRSSNAFVTNYPAYLKALAKLNWPVDGYTVHSYPAADGGPAQRIEEIAQFKTLLAQNGAPVQPILDTELNYGLAGLGQARRVIDPATGAAYLSQSFIQSVQYGVDSLFWFLWTQADYDKLGIQLNAGTPQTIQAWKQTYEWLVGQQMAQCAFGAVVQACQMTGPKGRYTLLWTSRGEVSVDVTGLGRTIQYLDGSTLPIGPSNKIGLGIAPVAVLQ